MSASISNRWPMPISKVNFATTFVSILACSCFAAWAGDKKQENRPSVGSSAEYQVSTFTPMPGAMPEFEGVLTIALPSGMPSKKSFQSDSFLFLQAALVEKGCYKGVVDGKWNSETGVALNKAVRSLRLKLEPEMTFDSLLEAVLRPGAGDCLKPPSQARRPDSAPSIPGDRDDPDYVTALQTALQYRRCYAARIDGKWGRQTERALQRFAKSADGAIVPGELSPNLVETIIGHARSVCHEGKKDTQQAVKRDETLKQKADRFQKRYKKKRRATLASGRTSKRNRGRSKSKRRTVRAPVVFVRPVGVGRF